jgi:hypothetical protein
MEALLILISLFDRPHRKPIFQRKISRLLQRELKREGQKLWKQRLGRDLQHCQWRKSWLIPIQFVFSVDILMLLFV